LLYENTFGKALRGKADELGVYPLNICQIQYDFQLYYSILEVEIMELSTTGDVENSILSSNMPIYRNLIGFHSCIS
jgi:hypothetical protein